MTDEEALRKAGNAKVLLDDPTFKEAFECVENGIIKALKNVDLSKDYQETSKHRDSLMLSLVILGKVQNWLQQAVDNGKIVESELERKSFLNEGL